MFRRPRVLGQASPGRRAMSDTFLETLHALLNDNGRFVLALRHADSGRAAIAGALDAVDADVRRGPGADASGAVGGLEALLRRRLQAAHLAGELLGGTNVEELAGFYASIVIGLLAAAMDGGTPRTLDATRRMAMRLWPARAPASA